MAISDSRNIPHPPGPKLTARQALDFVLQRNQVDRIAMFRSLKAEYGDLVYLQLAPKISMYLVSKPEVIHKALVANPEMFRKGRGARALSKRLGNGLITSEGEFHKRQRKLAQPAFHATRISAYADTMVDYTHHQIDGWKANQEIDIHAEMMELTMNIISKTMFDATVVEDAAAIGEAITAGVRETSNAFARVLKMPAWVPTPAHRRGKRSEQVMNDVVMRFINERRASGEDKGDLLSMLLAAQNEDGESMTDQQVRDEVMTAFAAGHETTANALSWTFYLLAQHPDIMQKLVAEVDQVLGNRNVTMADLPRLTYTDMVIKEAIRIFPPVWTMGRTVLEDIEVDGYTIKAGSSLLFSQYLMHHDERFFSNPEAFTPERWANDFEKSLPKFVYFPFGAGPRVCIGQSFAIMEARLLLATIVQNFQMTLVLGQTIVAEPLVTLRPRDRIRMLVQPRIKQTQPDHAVEEQLAAEGAV